MVIHVFIAASALFGIFVLFLVLSKTLNNIVNQFVKLQYLLQKEYDLKKERLAIAQLLDEEKVAPKTTETAESESSGSVQSAVSASVKKPSGFKK
jgi:hypothetical protein